jgi:hypothetical protein
MKVLAWIPLAVSMTMLRRLLVPVSNLNVDLVIRYYPVILVKIVLYVLVVVIMHKYIFSSN